MQFKYTMLKEPYVILLLKKNKIDKQIYTHAIKTYFEQTQIDKRKLIKYSRKLGIELTLRSLMEVLG